MRTRIFRIPSLSLLLLLPALHAQPVLTPSPNSTASGQAAEWGPYRITNSFETGYRFTTSGGDKSLFRSVENYGNGLRLFGGSFTANSKDGHGRLFDAISLTTTGLGNDPYGMANVLIEKNHLYRYDMTWRRNDYYNPSMLNGAGVTLKNTRRTVQDHDFSVSPASWAKLLMGYTRNHETGPEFTAYETYIGGLARSLVPLARDTRRDFNEYRLGTELDFARFRLSITHRWAYYKDDSPIASLIPGQPYEAGFLLSLPFDPTWELTYPQVASSYTRSQVMHTHNGSWFGNLKRKERHWAINARMTYSKADSTTSYYENQVGPSQAAATGVPTGDGRFLTSSNSGYGPIATAWTYMPGVARRPFLAGDFSFNLFPTRKLSIMSSTSVSSNRYDGTGSESRVISTGAAVINRISNFHLGTGRVTSALDLNYKVNKWLSLNAEYRYSTRFIDYYLIRTGTTVGRDINSMRNHMNTGTFGFHLKPIQPLSVAVDGTIGRDNYPQSPTSLARFHNIRARVDYRASRMQYGLTYRQVYNLNAPLSRLQVANGQLLDGVYGIDYNTSHSRDWSAHSSFEASRHLTFDLSYTKSHLDTLGNLWAELVPAGSTTVTSVLTRGYSAQYIANLHTVSLIARTTIGRGTLEAGYNLTRDTGDGRDKQNLGLTNIAAASTASWTTFPMTYQAPLARLSLKLTEKLQWNFGWEFYRYNQEFAYFGYQPYYRAHTGYTSVTWAF